MSPYRAVETTNRRFVGRTTDMDDASIRAFCIGEDGLKDSDPSIDMRRMVRISDGADRVERLCVAAADSLSHVQPLVITCHGIPD